MITLGLFSGSTRYEPFGGLSRHFFDKKKVGVFRFLTNLLYRRTTESLFPSTSAVFNLASTGALFPKACAADDLSLSLAGPSDQIEFFNNFVISNNPNELGEASAGAHGQGPAVAGNADHGDFLATGLPPAFHDEKHQLAAPIQHFKQENDTFNEFYHSQVPQHHLPAQSNFSGKETGFPGFGGADSYQPYFDDFNVKTRFPGPGAGHGHRVDEMGSVTSSVSSSDSYISPLDDEFFRKLSNSYQHMDTHMFQEQPATLPSSAPVHHHHHHHSHGFAAPAVAPAPARPAVAAAPAAEPTKKRTFESVSSPASAGFSFVDGFGMQASMPPHAGPQPESQLSRNLIVRHKSDSKPKRVKKEDIEDLVSKRARGEEKNQFQCDYCEASFKVKGYLTRHLKKHSTAAFSCPFYQEPTEGSTGTKCHPTGGFSRRDTYKTHLKALHFIYPPGTKSSERNSISGRCAGCFEYFENNVVWLERHIESGACKGSVPLGSASGEKGSEITVKNEGYDDSFFSSTSR